MCGQDSVTTVRRSAAESNSPPAASALLRCVSEQLRRSPAPLAPPLIRGLHEPRRVQRPAEARLVQPPPEQKLVDLLQLREREDRTAANGTRSVTDRAARAASSARFRASRAAAAAEAAGHPRHAKWHPLPRLRPSPCPPAPETRRTAPHRTGDGAHRRTHPPARSTMARCRAYSSTSSAASSSIVSSGRSDRHGSCHRSRDPAGARSRSTMSRRPRGVRMTTSMDGAERRGFGACGSSASGHDRN